jgi:muramoyltetrapeptide carboxypeptidase LdcA involved in peptidoglycan recycling
VGQGEGAGWRHAGVGPDRHEAQGHGLSEPTFRLRGATLWGGNLNVLTSLAGHALPARESTRRHALFLEDVNEHPYRVERHARRSCATPASSARQKAVI